MGRSVENPKKYIVSCRVDDLELNTLRARAKESGINISDLLRQTILQLESDLQLSRAVNG